MATRRTKEEKLKLIADYEASGLSMSEWCTTNSISVSVNSSTPTHPPFNGI